MIRPILHRRLARGRRLASAASALLFVGIVATPATAQTGVTPAALVTAQHVSGVQTGAGGGAIVRGVSDDGRWVAFTSDAGGIVPAVPEAGTAHVYLWDATTRTTTLVDRSADGSVGDATASEAAVSADGASVAFTSEATNLVPSLEQTGHLNVYHYDVVTGAVTLVTQGTAGAGADAAVGANRYSANLDVAGDIVTFASAASDLVADDDGLAGNDVYLWERAGETLRRLSEGDGWNARVDDTGTAVVWEDSEVRATTVLGPDDINGAERDVFIDHLSDDAPPVLVTRSFDPSTRRMTGGNGQSFRPEVSDGGRIVVFRSGATNLDPTVEDTNGVDDVYVWDRDAEGSAVRLLSRTATGAPAGVGSDGYDYPSPVVSGDGRYAAWSSPTASADVTGASAEDPGNVDVFLTDLVDMSVTWVSRPVGDVPGGDAFASALSDDGAVVLFTSTGDSAQVAGLPDGNGGGCPGDADAAYAGVSVCHDDLFAWVRGEAVPIVITLNADGAATADAPVEWPRGRLSGDGSRVVWNSAATDVVAGQDEHNEHNDVFTRVVERDVRASIADAEADEGADDQALVEVVITRSASGRAASVQFATADGTARAGEDYVAASGTATFAPGSTTATVPVAVLGDRHDEVDETFEVVLSDPAGVALDRSTGTVTIRDDDDPPDEEAPAADAATVLVDIPGGERNSTTAVQWSRLAFPDGVAATGSTQTAGEVLLASEAVFADALASGSRQATRPLLLTDPTQLEDEVLQELQRLEPTSVRILGGDRAVTPAVADALTDAGYSVQRTFGASRLETATAIAALHPDATTAILARAFPADGATDPTQAFADSLAAGGWAADTALPVLLTQTDVLSTATRTYLEGSSITTVLVVGGEAAIHPAVTDALQAMNIDVQRVSGATRFATAIDITTRRRFTSEDNADVVLLVEGQAPDAWAAGFTAAASAARYDAPIVLANGPALPEPTGAFLSSGTPEPDAQDLALVCASTADACSAAQTLLGLPPDTTAA